MTRKDLRHWLARSNSAPIAGTVVAWVAAESRHGLELALDWIDSKKENNSHAGWATLSGVVALRDDSQLDLGMLRKLLQRVERTIHQQPNLTRYTMNGFVISVGSYVGELTAAALKAGATIGEVSVDMGNTACQVPSAPEYIQKVKERGTIGKKRKTVRC
jgi:hypothetical protein